MTRRLLAGDNLFLAAVIVGAALVLLVGAAMWVELGVVVAHAGVARPSIMSCGSMTPHVDQVP